MLPGLKQLLDFIGCRGTHSQKEYKLIESAAVIKMQPDISWEKKEIFIMVNQF
jgi:hypothetical protein